MQGAGCVSHDALLAWIALGQQPALPPGLALHAADGCAQTPHEARQQTGIRIPTMRVEFIGHFQPCMTEIYLHIDARMADYIRTHPYAHHLNEPRAVKCLLYTCVPTTGSCLGCSINTSCIRRSSPDALT